MWSLSLNVGASTCWNPQGLKWAYRGIALPLPLPRILPAWLLAKPRTRHTLGIRLCSARRFITSNYKLQPTRCKFSLTYLFLQTLYMFQVVPPPIIKSTQLCIQLQVLSTNSGASCYRQLTVAVSNLFLVLIASRCFFIGVALKDVDLPVSLSPSFW